MGALCVTLISLTASAAPTVWATDDGVKLKRDQLGSPLSQGDGNPVWAPGEPIRLVSLRNETIALQVFVESDGAPISDVTVSLDSLTGPGGATLANEAGATDPATFVGRRIEHFVEHYTHIDRESGGPWGSLGWHGAAAPEGDWTGWVPDALIPVEVAPDWAPYPMEVPAGQLRAVWIDVIIPKDQAAGLYTGEVVVASGGTTLATLPVELDLRPAVLPDDPGRTFIYWSTAHLNQAFGDAAGAARDHLFKLLRRHRLTAMPWVNDQSDLDTMMPALEGDLYTVESGYEGPAEGMGDDLLVLGVYGAFGDPDSGDLAMIESMADQLAAKGILDTMDVFVYVVDESCGHSWGPAWNALLDSSTNPNVQQHVRTGWTCSQSPDSQPVDVVMTTVESYVPGKQVPGKTVWTYNGVQPYAGTFFTDADAVAIRANGWLQGMYDIPRWFFWHATFWNDWNNGGIGAYNPFTESETFHNQHGEWANGDGVLLYPGRLQGGFASHDLGMDGVIASIRLKNWRRGVQDAAYLDLAEETAPTEAAAIAGGVIPAAFTTASEVLGWSSDGLGFYEGRAALADLIAPSVPAEQPPVEQPPVEQPPVEQPPVEQPPVEQPPVEPAEPQELTVVHAAEGVVVDGALDEFDGAPVVLVRAGDAVLRATVMWDEAGLYLGALVDDPHVLARPLGDDGALWTVDGVELMVDPLLTATAAGDRDDRHVIATAAGDLRDASGLGPDADASLDMGITFAAVEDGDGYALELAIPWSGLGVTPEAGAVVGANLVLNDVSAEGLASDDWAAGAAGVPADWHTLRLGEPGEEPVVVMPEDPTPGDGGVILPPGTPTPRDLDQEPGAVQTPTSAGSAGGCTTGGSAGGSAPFVLLAIGLMAAVLRRRVRG